MPLKKSSSKTKVKNININKQPLLRIRKKIDKIDDSIHDLLMERADLVNEVIKQKRKESKKDIVIYRPSREYEILVRLIKRHKGDITIKSLISIWRKLISTYISIQGQLEVSFSGNIDVLVKNHFGSDINLVKKKSSLSSLKSLNNNKCNIAILPFPNKKNDWWIKLNNYSNISIVGSLSDSISGVTEALILSKQNVEYASKNVALYTSKITTKNIKSYSDFISSKGFNLICNKVVTSRTSIILFSIKISSNIEEKSKFSNIENYHIDNNINPKLIGLFSEIDKEVINGKI